MHDRVHSLPAQDHDPRQPADQKQSILLSADEGQKSVMQEKGMSLKHLSSPTMIFEPIHQCGLPEKQKNKKKKHYLLPYWTIRNSVM